MRKISMLNFKGGVGKSTITTNLGHALALSGRRVLIVDCDLQANASSLLAANAPPTLTQVLKGEAKLPAAIRTARERLDVLPSDHELNTAAAYIASQGRRAYYVLRNAMRELAGYEVVLYDLSPSYNQVTEAVLLASDELLIPCELAPFSIDGLVQMLTKLEQDMVDHELPIAGIIPSKIDLRYAMSARYLDSFKRNFGERVTPGIRTDADILKAQVHKQTIFEYNPASKAARDFKALAAHLFPERASP
jgi:chromosome partitioning protein